MASAIGPIISAKSEPTATPLTSSTARPAPRGVIDTPASADYFTFTTTGGAASFTVNTAAVGATLHARLELWSATGLVAVGASADGVGRVDLHSRWPPANTMWS